MYRPVIDQHQTYQDQLTMIFDHSENMCWHPYHLGQECSVILDILDKNKNICLYTAFIWNTSVL